MGGAGVGNDRDASRPDLVPQTNSSPTLEELREALADLERRLARTSTEPVPLDEPGLQTGSKLKRGIRRKEFRLLRPISRRSDRLGAELAGLALGIADELAAVMTHIEILQRELDRRAAASSKAVPDESRVVVDDEYYWAFERQMRGEGPLIEARLRQYEHLAVGLLDEAGREGAPLWIDVGCGRGEFLCILREWGWNVRGVDSSPLAVRTCREKGLQASLGDAMDYVNGYRGVGPVAISGIQLIEHLPKPAWIEFLRAAFGLLKPGGAILLETVNPQNPRALSDSFFADVSHTWPAHPETVRLMAQHVGFDPIELLFVNNDGFGHAMDFAVWGRKPADFSEAEETDL
jgi:SAM-dependent methyltransferase